MLAYMRYALATICFTLSVACLGLWWRSESTIHRLRLTGLLSVKSIEYEAANGTAVVDISDNPTGKFKVLDGIIWTHSSFSDMFYTRRQFGGRGQVCYFPLWFPALVCALAGVGIFRVGRQFALRSAIVATTVLAGLLGVVAAL